MSLADEVAEKYLGDSKLIELSKSLNLKELAEYMKCSSATAGRALEKLGLRDPVIRGKACKVKPVEWDEFTSYFLGYFWGDGCMHKPRNKTDRGNIGQLDITSSELEVIDLFTGYLGEFKVQSTSKGSNTWYRFTFSDRDWYLFLSSCGIKPNKSALDSPFLKIPDEVNFRHFVRGFLDSDGYASRYLHRGHWCMTCGLIAQKFHLDVIFDMSKLNWRYAKSRSLDVLQMSSKSDIERLYYYLYDNSTVVLSRKKLNIEKFIFE